MKVHPELRIKVVPRELAIRLAREAVERDWCPSEKRQWLVSKFVECYGRTEHGAEIHVREGSPPRGYVLVINRGKGCGDEEFAGYAIAHDSHGKRLGRFRYGFEQLPDEPFVFDVTE
jgi:hypothetical protein